MATIIKATGEKIPVVPKNGEYFKLDELQRIVDGLIEILYLGGSKLLVVNESGKLIGLPLNIEASVLFGDEIVGDVLICERKQIK